MTETFESVSTLWRREFDELEKVCPWAGPRPQSLARDAEAAYRFVAREEETAEFLSLVNDNTLVVFHGESGAGKSSLLNMGLIDALWDSGFSPYVWRNWGSIGDQDPEEFLAESLERDGQLHDEVVARLRAGERLTTVLDELYASRAVIVLDQFESLIRQRSDAFKRMAEWVLSVNRGHALRVVISLRSEFQHRLARLMHRARPFTTAYHELHPMDRPHQVRAVIEGPRAGGVPSIESEAVDRLMWHWADVKERQHEAPRLLAVQACLYSLSLIAKERSGGGQSVVSLADVDDLAAESARDRGANQQRTDIFSYSFDRAIEGRLGHCQQACESLKQFIPASLRSLARSCVVSTVGQLSSGGYKLERSVGDLFVRSMEREFRLTGWSSAVGVTAPEQLARDLSGFDYLAASRDELATAAGVDRANESADPTDMQIRRSAALQGVYPVVPWLDDPEDISAGAMLGYTPHDLFLEQLRAFLFAIDWLETASLVNLVSGGDTMIVSLVHDGFGAALESWAARVANEPRLAISAIVAFEGRRFDWSQDSAGGPFVNDPRTPSCLANLRWRYCRIIGSRFRSVVFVNCDFRGAVFKGCTFEGVTFVNCLVDGAAFVGCTIVGPVTIDSPDPADGGRASTSVTDLPGFLAEGEFVEELVDELTWYRRGTQAAGQEADCIYSPTSGVAAVPWQTAASAAEVVPWTHQTAGMAMYGGRLSSLMLTNCSFIDGGALALCYMAGSSLDLVEQSAGNVILYYTTVRGVAVTSPVEPERRDASASFSLNAVECVLANAFFGEGLAGDVRIRSSRVLNISNASEGLDVVLDDCMVAGGDNVLVLENSGRFVGFGTHATSREARSTLAQETGRMAYRSVPARLEVETRSGLRD